MEKTLKYSVHFYGELEPTIECPLGTYYVDFENKVFFFKRTDENTPYNIAVKSAEIMANIAAATNAETAIAALTIHKELFLLDEENVHEKDGKFVYDFRVEGEMQAYIKTKVGYLYGDKENEVFYFDSVKKGFIKPLLKKRLCASLEEDLNSDNPERQVGAKCILMVIEKWAELDDEDIVREDSSN